VNDAVTAGPGDLVRQRRESRGLSQQDVADALNLHSRVIEAIETQNWNALPGRAFARGYLRAYAKLLDVDADEVTQAFDAAVQCDDVRQSGEAASVGRKSGRGFTDLMQKHPGAVLTSSVGGVICAVLIVLWAVWPAAPGSSSAAAPAAATPDPVVPRPLPRQPQGSAPNAVDARTEAADSDAAKPAIAQAAAAARASDPAGARRITTDGNDRLQFSFTQECWVEIKDAHGANLYGDLSRGGDSLELVGHPPFHILLGNAPAVTLAFNGERVALAPHTRNNVGTLVLGQ
jgi:cytoskeleton protein RodZ